MSLLTLSKVTLLTMGVTALSVATAAAQTAHFVRIANDRTPIRLHQHGDDIVMRAARGTVLEVLHTEGDRFVHRVNNWYWVLLPRDAWGTQRAGWVSGRQVDGVEPVESAPAMLKAAATAPEVRPAATAVVTVAPAAPVAPPPPAPPVVSESSASADVVLTFDFARSDLTDDARHKLRDVVAQMTTGAAISFAVEGHADAIGSERYNQQLGLERAEAVKRELAEQLHVAPDRIEIMSYGETQPAAPNSTEEGRAQNRRVVIKVGR